MSAKPLRALLHGMFGHLLKAFDQVFRRNRATPTFLGPLANVAATGLASFCIQRHRLRAQAAALCWSRACRGQKMRHMPTDCTSGLSDGVNSSARFSKARR